MNQPPIEPMLRAVVEGASQGVLAVDAEGAIQWANPAAEILFAYSSGELTGRALLSLIPEQFRTRHAGRAAAYFREPRPRPMGLGLELNGLRKDGTEFPVEISLSHIVLPDGPLAIAFVADITARKRLQAERDLFFELSPDLICIAGWDGMFKQVNPAFTGLLGWTREELLSRPFETFIHPDDIENTRAAVQRVVAGQSVIRFENRYFCKDGSVRWLEWSAPGSSGQLIYAVARDITEAKQTSQAQQRLITVIENVPDFVGLTAADGSRRVLYINKAGREMLGLPPLEELRQMQVTNLGIFDANVQEQMDSSMAYQGHWSAETNLYHYHTREAIPVELSIFLILFNDGSNVPIAHAAVARDLRDRKRSQARLHSLTRQLMTVQEEERRRIARDLHDDVTQKLAGLAIELGLLRRQAIPGAAATKLSELQEKVAAVAEDLRNLAHELHPGVLEHVGLGSALEAYCRENSRQRGIAIQYSARGIPDGIPPEIALTVYRVAQEAVGNAVKHAEASLVTVTLTGSGGGEAAKRLKLTVADNGKGFLISEIRDGSGLGLLSIEERVHLVQGNFTIHSDPGEGTRLEVEIPLP